MIENMYKADYPEFLKNNDFKFELQKVLNDSVFYAVTDDFDSKIVKNLSSNFFNFVLVSDFVLEGGHNYIVREMTKEGFMLVHRVELNLQNLYNYQIYDEPREVETGTERGKSEWQIFEIDNRRVSIFAICDQSLNAFKQIYKKNSFIARAYVTEAVRHNKEWDRFLSSTDCADYIYNSNYLYPIYLVNKHITQEGETDIIYHNWLDFPVLFTNIGDYKIYSNSQIDNRASTFYERYIQYHKQVHNYENEVYENQFSLENFQYINHTLGAGNYSIHDLSMRFLKDMNFEEDLSWVNE